MNKTNYRTVSILSGFPNVFEIVIAELMDYFINIRN